MMKLVKLFNLDRGVSNGMLITIENEDDYIKTEYGQESRMITDNNNYLNTETDLRGDTLKTEYNQLVTEIKQTEYENLETEIKIENIITETNSAYFPIETERLNNINYIPIATENPKYIVTDIKKEVKSTSQPKKSILKKPDMKLDLNNNLLKNYLNSTKRKTIKEQYDNIVRKSQRMSAERNRLNTTGNILQTEENKKTYSNLNTESGIKKKRRFLNTSVTIDDTVKDRLASVDNRKIAKYIKEENKILETKESRTKR